MKKITILKFTDPLIPDQRQKLNNAASEISYRTGVSITPFNAGFAVTGEWRGKFASEEAFVRRIQRDLALVSGVMFEAVIED